MKLKNYSALGLIIAMLLVITLSVCLYTTTRDFNEYRESVRHPAVTDNDDGTRTITIGDCVVIISNNGDYSVTTPDSSFAHTSKTIHFEFANDDMTTPETTAPSEG